MGSYKELQQSFDGPIKSKRSFSWKGTILERELREKGRIVFKLMCLEMFCMRRRRDKLSMCLVSNTPGCIKVFVYDEVEPTHETVDPTFVQRYDSDHSSL